VREMHVLTTMQSFLTAVQLNSTSVAELSRSPHQPTSTHFHSTHCPLDTVIGTSTH